ncbi:MAG: PD-(D/E)XK nuclease family protein, partial [Thermoanaerobaculia bacterium]
RLLRDHLRDLGRVDLGGRGAGVQILEVTEARGRTFEHLFLLGLNRGVFPRAVREDPMFPDSLRRVIGRQGHGVLPDLPLKLGGFDEERYLFAQLLASSPHVTLSWQEVDDDNAALTPSPLIERLRWSDTQRALPEARVAPDLLALPGADGAAAEGEWLSTATESSVLVALHGGRRRLAQVLPLALAEADDPRDTAPDSIEPPSSADAERLTKARLRVLDEMDPVRGTRPGESARARLGPYFGFVGEIEESDPRGHQPLYVTTLERLSGCPWQTFLERVLRIERFPDPLEILPGVDPPMVGDLVHRVLEQVVRQRLPEPAADLAAAHGTEAGAIPWPPEGELARVLQREAERVVRDHGIGLPGLPSILAQRVAPHLEAARDLEWSSGEGVPAVAVECHGELEVQDDRSDPQRLHFKADRVDRLPEGLRLSDYKTGRAISSSSRASTRRRELLRAVSSGGWLQAVAYALAAGGANDSGRYLFLGPDLPPDPELRSVEVRADDGELVAAFQRAVRILLGAWRRGHFFPRLVEPDRDREPSRCGYCAVAEACLRGDSGSRARLRDWAHRAGQRFLQEPMDLPSADRPLVAAWLLPSKHLLDESAGEEAGS